MIKHILLGLGLACGSMTFAQGAKTPVEYMNQISQEFTAIQSATWEYTRSVAKNKGARKVEKNRAELVQTISAALARVKKVPAFEGETYFKDSTIAFLELHKIVVSQDYEKIMNLEDISEQSYDLMEAYMLAQEIAGDKLSEAGDRIEQVEHKFADEHKITLIAAKDKTSEKLKNASEVYDYYNPVYLIFFKSYKQEAYLMEALNRGDVAAMEQNKSTLSKTAVEGLGQITEVHAYKSDGTLVKACEDILKFYQEEADEKFQVLIDFQTTKTGFDKAKAALDAKKEKDRTQNDIDAFNQLVGEFNKATNDYNKTIQELNANRTKFLNNWNNSSSNFTSRHI
jgi:hypothetical protein